MQATLAKSIHVKKRELAVLLIRKGINLNEINKELLTPVHIAADNSHCDLLEVLLKYGAKPNALDGGGATALHRCAAAGKHESCRLLLQYGVDPSLRNLQVQIVFHLFSSYFL